MALWRAITFTLTSKRPAFIEQCSHDTAAVTQEIFQTLISLLPPPSCVETQLQDSLRHVVRTAVDLSVEMRTQRANYTMLPPLWPEYDTNGDLAHKVYFNAALMNERSGKAISNEDLEAQQAVVGLLLFPPVIKKGDDSSTNDEGVVIYPAQVLVSGPH